MGQHQRLAVDRHARRQVDAGDGLAVGLGGDKQKNDEQRPIPECLPRSARRHGSSASTERSEEHTSELQSLMRISYAVFCLKKKKTHKNKHKIQTSQHK